MVIYFFGLLRNGLDGRVSISITYENRDSTQEGDNETTPNLGLHHDGKVALGSRPPTVVALHQQDPAELATENCGERLCRLELELGRSLHAY